jgi:hypothetical protein
MVSMRPFVVLAIKVMGPGPRRVKLVRLAHAMSDGRSGSRHTHATLHVAAPRFAPQAAPSRRAA